MSTTPVQALDRAINIVGGQTALAKELESLSGERVRQGNIWSWRNRTKHVPADMAVFIEHITREKGEAVPYDELCPDFPWELALAARELAAVAEG